MSANLPRLGLLFRPGGGNTISTIRTAQRVTWGKRAFANTPGGTAWANDPRTWPIKGYTFQGTRTQGYVGPPVYGPNGENLNNDKLFRAQPVPNCSITGKPRRQLGHYPYLGKSIVPFARRDFVMIFDNHYTPMPWLDEMDLTAWQILRGWFITFSLFYISWLVLYYLYFYPRRKSWHLHPGQREMAPFYKDYWTHPDFNPIGWMRPNNPYDRPRIISKDEFPPYYDFKWERQFYRHKDEFTPVLCEQTVFYGDLVYDQRDGWSTKIDGLHYLKDVY